VRSLIKPANYVHDFLTNFQTLYRENIELNFACEFKSDEK